MDTFENNEQTRQNQPEAQEQAYREEPVPQQEIPPQQEPAAYRGTGTGRRESPYANSPYVMNHPPRQEEYAYQQPYHYQASPSGQGQHERGQYQHTQYQQPQYQQPQYEPPQYEPPKKAKKEKKNRGGFWKKFLAAAAAIVLVAASSGITAAIVNQQNDVRMKHLNNQMAQLQDQLDSLSKSSGASVSGSAPILEGMTPGQVYAQNVQSVVAISCSIQTNSFYGTSTGTSTGSGFILSENGYIVTNHHVVAGASSVSVITHDGTEYAAQIVGSDQNNDVAVLKVEATGLPAAVIGSSDDLVIGDMVVAIGNPLGSLTATQTVGYVSGKDRDVTTDNTIINMIQTDAAINSGNSGGPLFNMKGEVVGITTAKYSGTSGSGASIEGIGFAIPIDDVYGIISDLVDYGYVTGAYLGVIVRNMDGESAAMYNLPMGAYVESVEAGGAASRAGIQAKDIIIDLGGYEVDGLTSLTRALRKFKAGDTTTITVLRGGTELVLEITLDEKPQATASGENQQDMPSGDYDEWYDWFFGDKD